MSSAALYLGADHLTIFVFQSHAMRHCQPFLDRRTRKHVRQRRMLELHIPLTTTAAPAFRRIDQNAAPKSGITTFHRCESGRRCPNSRQSGASMIQSVLQFDGWPPPRPTRIQNRSSARLATSLPALCGSLTSHCQGTKIKRSMP